VGMALLGGGDENGGIEKDIHAGEFWPGAGSRTESRRSSRTRSRVRSQLAPGSAVP
jgi:hypothetical protein